MRVSELISKLQAIDPDLDIEIGVQANSQQYMIDDYCEVEDQRIYNPTTRTMDKTGKKILVLSC